MVVTVMRGLQNTCMKTHVKEHTRQPKVVHIFNDHVACVSVALFSVPSEDRNETVLLIYVTRILALTLMGTQNKLGDKGFGQDVCHIAYEEAEQAAGLRQDHARAAEHGPQDHPLHARHQDLERGTMNKRINSGKTSTITEMEH